MPKNTKARPVIGGRALVPSTKKDVSWGLLGKILLWLFVIFQFCEIKDASAWEGIVIHHTASKKMTLEQCNAWHKARGWNECGYNFIISPEGNVIEARGDRKIGAHCKGYNQRFLGVAFVGENEANRAQYLAFNHLLDSLRTKHGDLEVYPHYQFRKTKCPGNIWLKYKGGIEVK